MFIKDDVMHLQDTPNVRSSFKEYVYNGTFRSCKSFVSYYFYKIVILLVGQTCNSGIIYHFYLCKWSIL